MFAPQKIAAALIALAAFAGLALLSPVEARIHCAPRDRACWDLHGPSSSAERARTAQLNREADQAVTQGDNSFSDSQRQYQRDLREYRQTQRRYENDMRTSRSGPRPAMGRGGPRRTGMAPRRRPETAEELDRDPCAPTGGIADSNIAAPTPGLNGSTTGLTTFNARTNGNYAACRAPRRR